MAKSSKVLALIILICFTMPNNALSSQGQKSATYVGSKKCKKCHQEIYRGWRTTFHPYKFQKATPETVIGDFTHNNRLTIDGKTTLMTRKGDKFFIVTQDPEGVDRTYRVSYVIGQFWKQMYVTELPNGELRVLPIMWIVKTQKWKKAKYWIKTPYQYACSGCHNTDTRINYDPKTDTYHTTWSDMGVACEACHGPGSKHIEAPREKKADTIVNPARIPDPRRAAMVCGSCHERGTSPDGKYAYPHDYKPGKLLSFHEKPKVYPNGSSRANRQQYIDWEKSPHARAGVMCWDCHFVHRKGKANRYQTKLPGSALCRSCHQVENEGFHGIHSVNNCIGCHMPAIGKRATKGDVHSHLFRVISPRETLKAGGLDKQPNSCNACHYHEKDSPQKLLKVLERVKASGWSFPN